MSPSSKPNDRWIKCLSTPGNIRGVAIQATDLVRQMAKTHGLKGSGARGLGESVIAGLLTASYCKSGERINLNIRGDGHYTQALVDAYPDGTVRGYVIERAKTKKTKVPTADELGPWGKGMLSVLRTKDEEGKQPYIGTVPLITGHLAKDMSFYWFQSEQIPSAVGLVSELEGDEIIAAGGFLVQALPGASPTEVRAIEEQIQDLHSISQDFARSEDPLKLLTRIFQNIAFMVVEERKLEFKCNCSWERVERALTLVGAAELKAMLIEDHQATVRCDFCNKEYSVDAEHLERLIAGAGRGRTDLH